MSNNFLENDEEKCYKQIFQEFKKTKDDVNDYIDIMRKWSETQLHFPEKPSYRTLRCVVLYNKFSIEKAKKSLDMFYSIRSLIPEYYRTVPFSDDMIFANKVMFVVPLPKVTDDYARIVYNKLNLKYEDPNYYDHDKLNIQVLHLLEYFVEADLCSRFHYIFDCSGCTIGHGTKTSIMALKKSNITLEKVFSNRLASLYFVNFPSFLDTLVNTVVKPMLNPKLRERVKIDSGTDILFDIFGKERMPQDIGGEEKPIEELSDMLMDQYRERQERFHQLANLEVDESKRPLKLQNDELLGYYGNFKKINVD